MNIRQKINRQITPYVIGFFSCFILVPLFGFITSGNDSLSSIVFIPFVIAAISIIRLNFIKCPSCKNKVGSLGAVSPEIFPFRVSSKIKHCPFCGINLDEDLENIANQSIEPIVKTSVESGKA